jgi:NADH dehydrogenase [ubiquinone] 1 alpha subcomplex assembly factor 7
MFGEIIGVWVVSVWTSMGRPAFSLVELGPGRGQLMADLLRATAKVPSFIDAADIHLVETSERLRDVQRKALDETSITWQERLETVPEGPLFLIANEVFDALPVHQLIRTEQGWAERTVALDAEGDLAFALAEAPPALLDAVRDLPSAEPGDIAEISLAREALIAEIGKRIGQGGGLAMIIDYGAWVDHATGDTLQAVRRHKPVHPLTTAGEVDLTTQVDFRRLGLAAVASSTDVYGPVPQGPFLRTLGIEMRIAALLGQADQEQGRRLREGLFRLTDAGAMGEAFKVLVLASPEGPPPPGFSAPSLRCKRPSQEGAFR